MLIGSIAVASSASPVNSQRPTYRVFRCIYSQIRRVQGAGLLTGCFSCLFREETASRKDATMSQDRNHRISSAIDSLIAHLIPTDPHDDEETAQARHDNCFELVRSILET